MAQVIRQLIQVNTRDQLTYSLSTHTSAEDIAKVVFQLTIAILLQQVHLLQTFQISTQLLDALASLVALTLHLGLHIVDLTLEIQIYALSFTTPLRLRAI